MVRVSRVLMRAAQCVVVALAVSFAGSTAAVAQQPDAVREINGLVNEAFGELSHVRDTIYKTRRRLSEWEADLARGAVQPASNLGASVSGGAVAQQIAAHPMISNATRDCQDELRALGMPDQFADPVRALACARNLSPRIRFPVEMECASLFWTTGASGQLRLTGHVQSGKDRQALSKRFSPEILATVKEVPYPACAAVTALEIPMTSDLKPEVRMLSNQTRIPFNESLAFEVVTPDFYAFLYLVYLQADGSVVNLLPKRGLMRAQHAPNTQLLFGDGRDGRRTFTATAPAGAEAIVALASRSPIDLLDDLEQGAAGQYAQNGSQPLTQPQFLKILDLAANQTVQNSTERREISAEVLYLNVIP